LKCHPYSGTLPKIKGHRKEGWEAGRKTAVSKVASRSKQQAAVSCNIPCLIVPAALIPTVLTAQKKPKDPWHFLSAFNRTKKYFPCLKCHPYSGKFSTFNRTKNFFPCLKCHHGYVLYRWIQVIINIWKKTTDMIMYKWFLFPYFLQWLFFPCLLLPPLFQKNDSRRIKQAKNRNMEKYKVTLMMLLGSYCCMQIKKETVRLLANFLMLAYVNTRDICVTHEELMWFGGSYMGMGWMGWLKLKRQWTRIKQNIKQKTFNITRTRVTVYTLRKREKWCRTRTYTERKKLLMDQWTQTHHECTKGGNRETKYAMPLHFQGGGGKKPRHSLRSEKWEQRIRQQQWHLGVPKLTAGDIHTWLEVTNKAKIKIIPSKDLGAWVRRSTQIGRQLAQLTKAPLILRPPKVCISLVDQSHWIMVINNKTEVEIWDAYGHASSKIRMIKIQHSIQQLTKKAVRIVQTHQQAEQDKRTCGYQVLRWVQDFMTQEQETEMRKRWMYKQEGTLHWIKKVTQDLGFFIGRGRRATEEQKTKSKELTEHNKQWYNKRKRASKPQKQIAEWVQEIKTGTMGKKKKEQTNKAWIAKTGTARIFSQNINGGFKDKAARIGRWVQQRETPPMIMAFQETQISQEDVNRKHISKLMHFELPQYEYIGNQSARTESCSKRGVAILVNRQLSKQVEHEAVIQGTEEAEGRILMVPIRTLWEEQRLWIVNIYAPVTLREKNEFYMDQLPQYMAKLADVMGERDLLYIAIDANAVIDSVMDAKAIRDEDTVQEIRKTLDRESRTFNEWVEGNKLEDVWRNLHPQEQEGTRNVSTAQKLDKRIDYVFAGQTISHLIEKIKIIPTAELNWNSDHKAIECEINGLQKMKEIMGRIKQRQIYAPKEISQQNEELQKHAQSIFKEGRKKGKEWAVIRSEIQEMMNEKVHKTRKYRYISEKRPHSDKGKALEEVVKILNKEMKRPTQGMGRQQLKKEIKDKMKKTMETEEVNKLTELPMIKDWKWKQEVKKTVIQAAIEEARRERKLMIRVARMKTTMGEYYMPWAKSTYARGKEWQRPDTGILVLKDEQGKLVTGREKQEVIIQYMKKQWTQVKQIQRAKFQFGKQASKSQVQEILNKIITGAEVQKQAEILKDEKSPGTDLLPNELWKGWESETYEELAELFQEIFEKKREMPQDWKDVVIKWMYKAKSPLEMTNYRPIALGNTLSKLYMRILNGRLEELVETTGIVSEVQQGFRTDRSCAGAIMIIQMLAGQKNAESKTFYMTSIDISKAYDTVNHEVLWKILEAKGITGPWLQTVQEMYSQGRLQSDTTEGATEWIAVNRGIRQGCPMSPLLFAVYVDWITESQKKYATPKQVVTEDPTMLLYADDMELWACSKTELKTKLIVLEKAMLELGMTINWAKTKVQGNKWAILQGDNLNDKIELSADRTLEILRPTEAVRYLGAWIDADLTSNTGRDLLERKIEHRIKLIEHTGANPITKAMLLRSRVISLFNYTAGVQNLGMEWCQKMDSKLYQAITGGRGGLTYCRKDLIYQNLQQGGLGMISIQDEYKINRVRVIAGLIGGQRTKSMGKGLNNTGYAKSTAHTASNTGNKGDI